MLGIRPYIIFISEIEYAHLGLVLERYELIFHRLWNIVYGLESEQIHKGIGMTISGKITDKNRVKIFENITKKIGTNDKEKLAKILGPKLIKNINKFSEDIERSRIADEIHDEIEISEEKMKIPPGFASVKEITKWAERRGFFKKCICGHEKVHHIDTNKLKETTGNLDSYIKKCKVKKSRCKKYEE